LPVQRVRCGAVRLAGTPCGQQRGSRGMMRQVLELFVFGKSR
jgi:hypothetical protein